MTGDVTVSVTIPADLAEQLRTSSRTVAYCNDVTPDRGVLVDYRCKCLLTAAVKEAGQ